MGNNKNSIEMVNNNWFDETLNAIKEAHSDTSYLDALRTTVGEIFDNGNSAWADDINDRIKNIKLSKGMFNHFVAGNVYGYTPCSWVCNSDCEHCAFAGKENEFILRDMIKKLNYVRQNMFNEKVSLRSIYGELLNVAMVVNQVAGKKMDLMVEEVRAVCNRMLKDEIKYCYELVSKMFYMATQLIEVDMKLINFEG